MKRLFRIASGLPVALVATAPVLAQGTFTERCTGETVCLAGSDCKIDRVTFDFDYIEAADGSATSFVTMPGGPRAQAVFEGSTQGYTWSTPTRVYTLIYLLNDAFAENEPAEFMLVDAPMNGRLGAVVLSTGTCVVVN